MESNAGYTIFRCSVKSTGYLLHSPVSPSLPLPCVTVCHHISTGVYVLTWRIWWAPNNASKSQMGFNSAFKGLILYYNSCLAFSQNCEERPSTSSCLSVLLHGTTRPPMHGFSWNSIFEDFSKICREKFKFNSNLTRITGTLHEDIRTFKITSRWILLRTRNFPVGRE